jgi:hypothetical protein
MEPYIPHICGDLSRRVDPSAISAGPGSITRSKLDEGARRRFDLRCSEGIVDWWISWASIKAHHISVVT